MSPQLLGGELTEPHLAPLQLSLPLHSLHQHQRRIQLLSRSNIRRRSHGQCSPTAVELMGCMQGYVCRVGRPRSLHALLRQCRDQSESTCIIRAAAPAGWWLRPRTAVPVRLNVDKHLESSPACSGDEAGRAASAELHLSWLVASPSVCRASLTFCMSFASCIVSSFSSPPSSLMGVRSSVHSITLLNSLMLLLMGSLCGIRETIACRYRVAR